MKQILIVDDDATNRKLFSFLLAKTGYAVKVAVNGSEAVQQVMTDDFAAVLMDLKMPVMDGFEATARIREWEKQKSVPPVHLPIIAITAVSIRQESREELLAAGFNDLIMKTGMSIQSITATLTKWIPLELFPNEPTPLDNHGEMK